MPQLEQAIKRIADTIPKDGWKVLFFGRDERTKARVLTLKAEYVHGEDRFLADITVHDQSRMNAGASTSRLLGSLTSACYRVPEGVKAP
ncbi:hypothetical protein [Streptomyces smaragdinus]|uniref:hypothetical protein n=1 Tax=Streptomyces smaragdinus TaxID=2585196 RepID=UPI001298210A|nr:hypothetical protein [Streptomyces smaragdinus]